MSTKVEHRARFKHDEAFRSLSNCGHLSQGISCSSCHPRQAEQSHEVYTAAYMYKEFEIKVYPLAHVVVGSLDVNFSRLGYVSPMNTASGNSSHFTEFSKMDIMVLGIKRAACIFIQPDVDNQGDLHLLLGPLWLDDVDAAIGIQSRCITIENVGSQRNAMRSKDFVRSLQRAPTYSVPQELGNF